MRRFCKLLPLLVVVALTLVAAVPVMAAVLPPAVYLCTVYEDNVLVGAGKVVEAFVGTEAVARGQGTTGANGQAVVQFSVTEADLGKPLSFTVDGHAAVETPDVDVSIAGIAVRLDYSPVPPDAVEPTVTTMTAINIGETTVTLRGNLTDLGTATTVAVNFELGLTEAVDWWATSTVNRTATGTFTRNITGLSPNTTYYFRAKAAGDGTAYGDVLSFTTLAEEEPPTTTPEEDFVNWLAAFIAALRA